MSSTRVTLAAAWWLLGAVPLSASGLARAQQAPARAPAPTSASAPASAPAPASVSSVATTPAEPSVVFLKNGGLVRGELMELQPGTLVRLRLADGTVRELPWADVDHIADPALPLVLPLAESPAPAPAAEPAGAPIPAPTEQPPLSPRAAAAIAQLRAERADINSTIAGVAVYVGGTVAVYCGLSGALLLTIDCEDAYDDEDVSSATCDRRKERGRVLALIGGIAAVPAIWGLVTVLNNHSRRKEIDARIRELQRERAGLRFDVLPAGRGAALALTLRQ